MIVVDFLHATFWLALALTGYTYIGYPLLLVALVRLLEKPFHHAGNRAFDPPPTVAVIIAAHNEEAVIRQRIINLMELDYPSSHLRIYVGSDGSDDRTNQIVTQLSELYPGRLQFFPYHQRRGKISVLNDLMASVEEEIVVFTDANTHFKPDTITHLVEPFSNEKVGAACGELVLVSGGGLNQEHQYWSYEQFLKRLESRIDGLVGANGAIYAIRRKLYRTQPSDTITDDFSIIMDIARDGWRVVYTPEACAYEENTPYIYEEFRRRVRIGTGNYQALARFVDMLYPTNGIRSFTFLSHKVIRWFVPHLMIIIFITSLLLSSDGFFLATAILQSAVYTLSWYTYYHPRLVDSTGVLLRIPIFFVLMNAALFIGFIRFCSGRYSATWNRTSRV